MKQVSAKELADIINKSSRKLDFVLELGILQEPDMSAKPVYAFERAYVSDEDMTGDMPEFCLIYSEADDIDTILASISTSVTASQTSHKFDAILKKYIIYKTIYHCYNNVESEINGELCESFYYDNINNTEYPEYTEYPNLKILTPADKNLSEPPNEDNYLNIIFEDFIEDKIWYDCGIIGAFRDNDKNNDFAGYLAYYEIAENIRDVSYIYIKDEYRKLGYATKLLNYFKNKNTAENKISYYSYAENDISKSLAQSCGFIPCAQRYEN